MICDQCKKTDYSQMSEEFYMPDDYKVAYYVRVSREEQAKGYSPEGQRSIWMAG